MDSHKKITIDSQILTHTTRCSPPVEAAPEACRSAACSAHRAKGTLDGQRRGVPWLPWLGRETQLRGMREDFTGNPKD